MEKKIINKILNKGASSESDLNFIAQSLNLKIKFIGSIYDINKFNIGNYILLITPSKEIRNGHWVALKVGKTKSYYFDSYGLPPPETIAKNIHTPLYYNNIQVQDLRSNYCGIYAIYFLKEGPEIFKHFKIHNIY